MEMTAEDYGEVMLHHILPKGEAWLKSAQSTWAKLMTGLGFELSRVDSGGRSLNADIDPTTCSEEVLTQWESVYGLPHTVEISLPTLSERRAMVIFIRQNQGNLTAKYVQDIAALYGYVIEITEFFEANCESNCEASLNPNQTGVTCNSPCDSPLDSGLWGDAFLVRVTSPGHISTPATCESDCQALLSEWAMPIEELVRRLAPGQSTPLFAYG